MANDPSKTGLSQEQQLDDTALDSVAGGTGSGKNPSQPEGFFPQAAQTLTQEIHQISQAIAESTGGHAGGGQPSTTQIQQMMTAAETQMEAATHNQAATQFVAGAISAAVSAGIAAMPTDPSHHADKVAVATPTDKLEATSLAQEKLDLSQEMGLNDPAVTGKFHVTSPPVSGNTLANLGQSMGAFANTMGSEAGAAAAAADAKDAAQAAANAQLLQAQQGVAQDVMNKVVANTQQILEFMQEVKSEEQQALAKMLKP